MSKLKTYPVDLLGTAPSNKVTGEVRTIVRNEDRIFIPTGGPFFTKSLKVWRGTTLLTPGVDYKGKELNRDATIDSGKEVCNAIQILNGGTTFTYEYQVIGGCYMELGEELASFIQGTPLGDYTKIDYSNVLYKPTSFPPSPHTHVDTDWQGYGESIYLVNQLTASAGNGRQAIYAAIRAEAQRGVEEYVEEYIAENGFLVKTDDTPTVNGNVLLTGNGLEPSPLTLDSETLFKELDMRYTRNVINPLTRVGAISDSFLPITTGFFNVAAPFIDGVNTTAVAKIERNGDLLCLAPASNGELVRYIYGYVREWAKQPTLSRYTATNQQYRPPGLTSNEEIMDLLGINNQTMIAAIYSMTDTGLATFKEHAIIELNDTLLQESHSLVRIGTALSSLYGTTNAEQIRQHRPTIVKPRGGSYHLIHRAGETIGGIQIHQYNGTNSFVALTNWNCFKETTTLKYHEGAEDEVISKNTVSVTNRLSGNSIVPFSWFRQGLASNDNGWIIDDSVVSSGYEFLNYSMGSDLYAYTEGSKVYLLLTHSVIKRLYQTADRVIVKDIIPTTGVTYRLELSGSGGNFYWVRTKRDFELPSVNHVNAEQGYCRQLAENVNDFEYKIPFDMAGGIHDPSWFHRSSQIGLGDGTALIWRPLNASQGISQSFISRLITKKESDTAKRFNGYYHQRQWEKDSLLTQMVSRDRINLELGTSIPLEVTAQVLNNGVMLLQEGNGNYSGGPTTCKHYLYKPSTKETEYKTANLGAIKGYATSDDRKFIGTFDSKPLVNSRTYDGACRYSSMVFHQQGGKEVSLQTKHRQVTADYATGTLNYTQPYYIAQRGFDQIEFALNSFHGGDRHSTFWSWAIIVSPTNPNVGLLDYRFATADAHKAKTLRTAAKLAWNTDNELIGFTIRPAEAAVSTTDERLYLGVVNIERMFFLGTWGIQYNQSEQESYWHGRMFTGLRHGTDNDSTSDICTYKQTFGTDGFPRLRLVTTSGRYDGRSLVATTENTVGLMTDRSAYGILRLLKPFLNWEYISGTAWSETTSRFFAWYSPRPTEAFNLRIADAIELQLGGVNSEIPAGYYSLTDPAHSTITNPKNKTIFIYATLNRGVATLQFEESILSESTYVVYLGQCVTDGYGVVKANLAPASRIGNYRPSPNPQGSAFSASSGSPETQRLLNWDADIPENLVLKRNYVTIVGDGLVPRGETRMFAYIIDPEDAIVRSVEWVSLNPSIGTVDQTGLFTALNIGTVVLRCIVNGETIAEKYINVDVPSEYEPTVVMKVEGPSTLSQYSTAWLSITFVAGSVTINSIVWESLNTAVGTVTQGGLFTAVSMGNVTIRCIVNGEFVAAKTIAVTAAEVGIDMRQKTGNVSFDVAAGYMKVVQDGQFFVKNREQAIALFNGFIAVKTSGGTSGANGYLNGHHIWKGKGTSWNRWRADPYIVEGWNTVHMEWGELWIEARLFG